MKDAMSPLADVLKDMQTAMFAPPLRFATV